MLEIQVYVLNVLLHDADVTLGYRDAGVGEDLGQVNKASLRLAVHLPHAFPECLAQRVGATVLYLHTVMAKGVLQQAI